MKKLVSALLILIVLCILTVPAFAAEFSISVPLNVDAYVGDPVDIICDAVASDDSDISYVWYESYDGTYMNCMAYKKGAETSRTLRFTPTSPGVSYFFCLVSTENGDNDTSNIVAVTAYEKAPDPPEIKTTKLNTATAGESYKLKLKCSDDAASFSIYQNPGKKNDFEKTGLTLTESGEIKGTPKSAGSFTFTVIAVGEGGEGYMTYTLTVKEAAPVATEAPATPEPEEPADVAVQAPAAEEPSPTLVAQPQEQPAKTDETPAANTEAPPAAKASKKATVGADSSKASAPKDAGVSWVIILLAVIIVLLLAGGTIVIVILVRKNRKR